MMSSLTYLVLAGLALVQAAPTLKSCGPANYDPTQYTCYNNKDLCPVINGMPKIQLWYLTLHRGAEIE